MNSGWSSSCPPNFRCSGFSGCPCCICCVPSSGSVPCSGVLRGSWRVSWNSYNVIVINRDIEYLQNNVSVVVAIISPISVCQTIQHVIAWFKKLQTKKSLNLLKVKTYHSRLRSGFHLWTRQYRPKHRYHQNWPLSWNDLRLETYPRQHGYWLPSSMQRQCYEVLSHVNLYSLHQLAKELSKKDRKWWKFVWTFWWTFTKNVSGITELKLKLKAWRKYLGTL